MAYWLRSSTVSAITIALLVLPSILAPVSGNAQTRDSAFQFGVLGDMPYTKVQEPEYRRVLEALNRADLAFVGEARRVSTPNAASRGIASRSARAPARSASTRSWQPLDHGRGWPTLSGTICT